MRRVSNRAIQCVVVEAQKSGLALSLSVRPVDLGAGGCTFKYVCRAVASCAVHRFSLILKCCIDVVGNTEQDWRPFELPYMLRYYRHVIISHAIARSSVC